MAAVLLLTVLTTISPVVAVKPPKPMVKFAIQNVGYEGGWISGTIYEDDSATGSGSICNLDFTVGPPPGEEHGLVWQVTVTAATWDGSTLTVWVDLYSPKLGILLAGGPPEAIGGLSEGHNDIDIFGNRHIVQIHTIP